MREALFIKRNKEKWEQFDGETSKDPDIRSHQFVETIDDLAYSQTFYPGSKTTQYLNERSVKFYNNIYRNKREKFSRIFDFWRFELPLIVGQHHKQMLYASAFFLIACLIGALSAKYDTHFLGLIVGDDYVNMTQENIENGDPFGVYKRDNPTIMFLEIMKNNIQVGMMCFVFGITCSVMTVFVLVRNGIMLGSFQYFFFAKGLGWQSVLVIWIHGTLEISAIILSGFAGFILGNSILFPGTYSRGASLKRGAVSSAKVMFGIIPLFVIAAILEGYITRLSSAKFDDIHKNQTELTIWGSSLILAVSFLFVVGYFIIYPIWLRRKTILQPSL
jgi:uncharacterized membrane protein SpoIIM required for sporulation